MINRCTNSANVYYDNYGGRGIKVCERWLYSFEAFVEDMGYQPEDLTIDRINNAGGYKKANCRWATRIEQNRNRRGV